MRFLVVDDSATMRRIVINCLNRIGFPEVVEARDGLEALERFDGSVGCIITDCHMPGMGGLELARTLRERPDGLAVPILLVATPRLGHELLQAFDAGVDDYILKPFSTGALKEKLARLLDGVPVS